VQIREIEDSDLEAVLDLLIEGFPRRDRAYWRLGLDHLRRRPRIGKLPRYGYLIDADGPQGLILLITSKGPELDTRCNLSSWYVRRPYRTFATLLFKHALRGKKGTFLNLSPSSAILPTIQGFGFKPYTTGQILLNPFCALRTGKRTARIRDFSQEYAVMLSDFERELAATHIGYGCSALISKCDDQTRLLLYRVRYLKDIVPCAQILYGSSGFLCELSQALSAALLLRGLPLVIFDAADGDFPHPFGHFFPNRGVRYCMGAPPPVPGDLAETELAIFGP
jgi:hypothetical protein